MSTTYYGQHSGIVLKSGFAAKNPVTIAANATIASGAGYNGDAVYGANYTWTIDNLGTIDGTGTASIGVDLKSGGSVSNGPSGTITGYLTGVSISGAPGTVENSGTILGIDFGAGGTITNEGGADIDGRITFTGDSHYPFVQRPGITIAGGPGEIVNYGSIGGSVYLNDGGSVENAAGGSISERLTPGQVVPVLAVIVSGEAGSVDNSGNIAGLVLAAGGSVINAAGGVISTSALSAVYVDEGPAIIDNSGTISSTNRGFPNTAGITLSGGGSITNEASGLIADYTTGVRVTGGLGNVLNLGTIETTGTAYSGQGLYLGMGGTVGNAGSIVGYGGGIVIRGAPGYVGNTGVIADTAARGVGVILGAGGTLINQPGALVSGYEGGIFVEAGVGVVINRGSISGTDNAYAVGVYLGAGGVVGNSSRVTALSGSGIGVEIKDNAYLTNGGLIAGSRFGVELLAGPDTVVNYGRITGTGADGVGVYLAANGSTVTNAGRIVGRGGTAAYFAGSYDTLVVDPGTSFGGAVGAGGGGDTLELASGAAAGTLDGLGSNFVGFDTVRVDPGASWYLSGSGSRFVNDGTIIDDGTLLLGPIRSDPGNQGLIEVGGGNTAEFAGPAGAAQRLVFTDAAGTALLDHPRNFHALVEGFTEGDVIDLIGRTADGLSYADHQLVLTEGGNLVADLHFAGHYTASQFALYPDGSGGTYLTLTGATATADFWKLKS